MTNPKIIIPYGRQDISREDIKEVTEVLNSDFLTQGPKVPLFEKKVADYCGAKFGVAVNSATSALHAACYALGLGEGDYLWTSPNSYVASANCGLYCGAKVDFVDIDPNTYNLCVSQLEKKLISAEMENKLPKIVIAVHFAGQPCEMEKIYKLSLRYNFSVIEDASHSIGGKYLDQQIGSCKFSDITVFSFHPVKIITTAEGGMAMTNSEELAKCMEIFRAHGVTKEADQMNKKEEGPWYYEQINLGFNYRMTEIQAALGISQLKKIDKFIARRHELKDRYNFHLRDLPIIRPYEDKSCYSAFHLYPIQIDTDKKSRRYVFEQLKKNGIGVNVHYIPIHTQPYYQNLGFNEGDFPIAEAYYSKAISIPLFYSLKKKEQDSVIELLKTILK
tara:strand:- start:4260 stop:5429 length:1170 start_codon:yes stop_codon:yes gene_type:complete